MANISIIGSGSFGTAIAVYLSSLGHGVTLWSRRHEFCEQLEKTRINERYLPNVKIPPSVRLTSELADALPADILVLALPSHAVRAATKMLSPLVCDKQIVLSIAKGFDEEKYLRLSEVISEEIPSARVAVMSGPSHAEEVAIGLPTTNVVASADEDVRLYVQRAFHSENFRIYTSADVVGVELGGALKNVIALCAGISDGLGYGDNTKAALMTRGIHEIARLGVKMGALPETFSGLSGVGDLIVTCTSMHSRNRRAGILIGKGEPISKVQSEIGMVIEGVKTAKAVHVLSERYQTEMPISEKAYQILFENADPKGAVTALMNREIKAEI